MRRQLRFSTVIAITVGLLLGYAAASGMLARHEAVPASAEVIASAPFVDTSGICSADDCGCFDEPGRATMLTTGVTNANADDFIHRDGTKRSAPSHEVALAQSMPGELGTNAQPAEKEPSGSEAFGGRETPSKSAAAARP